MAIHIEADPQTQTAKSTGIPGNFQKHVKTTTTLKAIFDFKFYLFCCLTHSVTQQAVEHK